MSAPSSPVLRGGLVLVLVTAGISGLSTFLNALFVQGANSDAFVTVRNLAVAGLLVPLWLLARSPSSAPLERRDLARLAVIGVVGGAIPFLLFFRGIELATAAGGAATASFGYRTLFLMATLLGVVALGERLNRRAALAALLLLVGNALLLALVAPVWTDGTLYVLLATALWAVEYTISKATLVRLPSSTVALGRMGFGAVALAGYLAVTQQWGEVGAFSAATWSSVAYSALLLAAFVVTWYAGLKRVELGVATSALVLGFPITWALALLVRGGRATPWAEAGALLVVAGVAIALGLGRGRSALRSLGARPGAPGERPA